MKKIEDVLGWIIQDFENKKGEIKEKQMSNLLKNQLKLYKVLDDKLFLLFMFLVFFLMLVLLRTTSFWPPSMVYISVQMLNMLQISIWASDGSFFHVLHHSCHNEVFAIIIPRTRSYSLIRNMYYKPEDPEFYNLNCYIEFPLLND